MAENLAQERTEPASGRKIQKARDQGQVAKSKEVNTACLIAGALLIFFLCGHSWFMNSMECVQKGLMLPGSWTISGRGDELLGAWMKQVIKLLLPFVLFLPLVALLANIAQVGFLSASQVLIPKWDRLNPIQGAKKFFSLQGAVEVVKSLVTISVIGFIGYKTLTAELTSLMLLGHTSLGTALGFFWRITLKLVVRVWIFMVVLAILDYIWQRWQYQKGLRMSKQEVKEEFKEIEGDPRIRARIRSLQRDLARRRMLEEVPKANVVITNPTHLAVALRYERTGDRAPVVVAKGADWIAEKIREIAREHDVPILENKQLAGFLYRYVKVGREIPVDLYQAVAQILAYVYRLKENARYGANGS